MADDKRKSDLMPENAAPSTAERAEGVRLESRGELAELRAGAERQISLRARADLRTEIYLNSNFDKDIDPAIKGSALIYCKKIDAECYRLYKSLGRDADNHLFRISGLLQMAVVTKANFASREILALPAGDNVARNKKINRINEDFNAEAKRITATQLNYLAHEIKGTGYINLEVLATLDTQALQIAELLALKENEDLKRVFAFLVDPAVKSTIPRNEVVATLAKYLERQNPDGQLMPILWSLMHRMKSVDRLAIASTIKAKVEPFAQFVEAGNQAGAFTAAEVGTLLGRELSDQELKHYSELWTAANDIKKRMRGIKGSGGNPFDRITGATIAGAAGMAAVYLTGGANLALGVWKDPMGLFSNEWFLGSGAIIAANHARKNPKPIALSVDKEAQLAIAHTAAEEALADQYGNTYTWRKWNEMLAGNGDYEAVSVLYELAYQVREQNGDEIPEGVDGDQIIAYLKAQAAKSDSPKKYSDLLKRFEEMPLDQRSPQIIADYLRAIDGNKLYNKDRFLTKIDELKTNV